MERVKELGDASVPFRFDVHAMIYSDNAPDLEYKLHQAFVGREVNLVNKRKEFYRVSLSEIEEVVQNNHKALIKFTKVAEAREYRETLAKISLQQRNQEKPQTYAPKAFPEDLF
jgi:cysteine synthase